MSSLGDVGAGHTLGRYELLVPIAQGGMAVVWAARMKGTRGFQKIVAVKTMLPEISQDPQFEEMFLAEAGLASRIRHPHVCEILDLGEQDGLIYIVMEWIDGEPLSQLARASRQKGGIPILVAMRLCLNAALGLHAAHELRDEVTGELVGLVHRDVSPQNILVTYDGVVKIVDFGVAKATTASDTGATKDGQLKGKVPFMSPEQALGKNIDRRTDVFALGIVLYQLLASKHPFRGDNDMITLRRICDKDPAPSLRDSMPSCPELLNDIVMKALEKDADRRYPTMSEFARALDRGIAELKLAGIPDEDVVGFVKNMLGERAEKRRAAIREGLRVADERAEQREQLKAQRAALLAQARANGGTLPPGVLSQMPSIPPGLLSIPPPAGAVHDVATIAHGRASLVPGTITATQGAPSSPTTAAIVADVDGAGAQGGGKKKLALVFAAVGALAIGGAAIAFTQNNGQPPAPATQPAASAQTPPAATPTPSPAPTPTTVASAAPAPTTSAATQPATPSTGATTTKVTTTPTATSTVRSTGTPSVKSTGTTKPGGQDNLPRVRDPGF
ncbi:serine/threonine-protein kinase [Polyangium spumosum]|uniref:Protein kinase n=1 Tax=Polyangium spumosum TaxID=889282 RepID=A0A6N7PSR6_9BACT|nr:serine/threonine-protein kinase [Polyangium spumosum]MRG94969.1 protein kinase [Polyangium spumosum]